MKEKNQHCYKKYLVNKGEEREREREREREMDLSGYHSLIHLLPSYTTKLSKRFLVLLNVYRGSHLD